MTRWFVLPRYDSWEPSPRWGGHKDWVSFNPLPLSNGHLDRVSFLLNQTGHLDPTRTTTHLVSLSLITSHLENKNEEEESQPSNKSNKETQERSSHKSYSTRIELGTLIGSEALICVLECCTLLLYWMRSVECRCFIQGSTWALPLAPLLRRRSSCWWCHIKCRVISPSRRLLLLSEQSTRRKPIPKAE